MTRRALLQLIVFLALFVFGGVWWLYQVLVAPTLDLSQLIGPLLFLGFPLFFLITSVRRLAILNAGGSPEDQPAIYQVAGKENAHLNGPMVPGRTLRWQPASVNLGSIPGIVGFDDTYLLFDEVQQRQRGAFGYHRAFIQTPEAFFQIDEESYVVRWLNYFSPHSTLYITDRATGARVAELPTTHVRAHLTVPEGDFDWDITGSVCFDAQGNVVVQARVIQDNPQQPYIALRVTEQYAHLAALNLLICVCTYFSLRYLGRDYET